VGNVRHSRGSRDVRQAVKLLPQWWRRTSLDKDVNPLVNVVIVSFEVVRFCERLIARLICLGIDSITSPPIVPYFVLGLVVHSGGSGTCHGLFSG